MPAQDKTQLSESVRTKIDNWMQRYPADQKRSAVIEALRYAQEENNNWLSEPLMDAVADYLGMPKIAVYEVATFYTMFNLKPIGQHLIEVCTNISCMLSGCDKIVDHLKKRLQINFNETTPDGKFTLREAECLAACAAAPMFQIGRKYYEKLTPEKVNTILDELE
ncbi:MAG: NADH-quinone oxidoreductase subunit NuoE [Gammaproteobacteria bacterium]|nr:NADH-quinone oxidoreductase subunit NuoE [Gammaproteobacteria bacterium]